MCHERDFDDLITTNTAWWSGFQFLLQELASNGSGQLEAWPVDDFVQARRYVACPRRGTHVRLVDCRACWSDVAWGYATASDVLAPTEQP